MKACVTGISVIGPGVNGWGDIAPVLKDGGAWPDGELQLGAPEILAPRERRRTSPALRLALGVCADAVKMSGVEMDGLTSVFASGVGDGVVCDGILSALSRPERLVSPTQFHNSVHNAAAGYWGIGTENGHSSVSIAAGEATFGAAFLRAMSMVMEERRPTVMVVSDHPLPGLLGVMRTLEPAMGVAMVLTLPGTEGAGTPLATLELMGGCDGPEAEPGETSMRNLFRATTAARGLPVLTAIAKRPSSPEDVVMTAGVNGFKIKVRVFH